MTVSRHPTKPVHIDHVVVGGGAPIVVQSMTSTDTADVTQTVKQIIALWQAGSELIRITVNNAESANAVAKIRNRLDVLGCNVPLIGDFHFNGHKLLTEYPDCAKSLAKYRINPGNVGQGKKRDEQFATIIRTAIRLNKPVRIGANWGSLDAVVLQKMMDANSRAKKTLDSQSLLRKALVHSAIESADYAVDLGLPPDRIIISCKVSMVQDLLLVYRALAKRCDYALHLGLTEAGMGSKGIVASSSALALLLQEGIGDTIRVSLTNLPDEPRTKEVIVAKEILQALGIRSFTPSVTACPGCGRTTSSYFQRLAQEVDDYLQSSMIEWKNHYPGVEKMKVAVMGCVVNGPGESRLANIGISLPGTGEMPVAPVYIDGEKVTTLKGNNLIQEFQAIVKNYVERKYG